MNKTLAIVVPLVNPNRYRSRYALFRDFKEYAQSHPNVKVYTVEMAFGGRPFEVTHPDDPCDIQLRGTDELWHKENLINIGVSRIPQDIRYIAWIDGDVSFLRPDIFEETVHQLQHYPVVQM